jgi:predicted PurR-regulated permease PerM
VQQAPATEKRIVIPRWVLVAAIPALLIIVWLLIGVIGEAIFIFLAAGLIAMVLNPLVRGLERAHVPRGLGVFVVYVAFVAALVGAGLLVIPPMVHQLRSLLNEIPNMVNGAHSSIERLQTVADRFGVRVDVAAKLDELANSLEAHIPSASRGLVAVGVSVVRLVTITIIVVVVSIYMLLQAKRISRYVIDHFPTGDADHGAQYVRVAQGAVVNYVKAQILLSLALGASVGVAMWFLSVIHVFPSGGKYAVFFGAWTGVMEAIPYLGPVLAAVPPTFVALIHSPLSALWVLLTFVLIQQIEGHILVPVIMGSRFRVNPLFVIFAILAGGQIRGVAGMFLAIPLIPLARETIVFFRARVSFEGWRQALTPAGDAVAAAGAASVTTSESVSPAGDRIFPASNAGPGSPA